MNTKKFKGMSNFFVWLFRMVVIFCIVGIVLALSIYFFNITDASFFEWHMGLNHLMEISLNSTKLSPQELMRPSLLTTELLLAMMSFLFILHVQLFWQ